MYFVNIVKIKITFTLNNFSVSLTCTVSETRMVFKRHKSRRTLVSKNKARKAVPHSPIAFLYIQRILTPEWSMALHLSARGVTYST